MSLEYLRNMGTNMLDIPILVYILLFSSLIIFHGILVSLYGYTCGFNIMKPSSWFYYILMTGSSWCNTLNWLTYVSGDIITHVWMYTSTFLIGLVVRKYIPSYSIPKRSK